MPDDAKNNDKKPRRRKAAPTGMEQWQPPLVKVKPPATIRNEVEAALGFARKLGREYGLALGGFTCVHRLGAERGAEWYAADLREAGYVTAWRTDNTTQDTLEVVASCTVGRTFRKTLWGFSVHAQRPAPKDVKKHP